MPRSFHRQINRYRGEPIFLDTVDGGRRGGAHEARLELLPVSVVVGPFARRSDPFAGGDGGGVPHHRDQIAVAARLDAENAEAVVAIVVGDALDKARQHFVGRWFSLEFHANAIIKKAQRSRWGRF